MAATWKEGFHKKLIKKYGEEQGAALHTKYCQSFPPSYRDDYSAETALKDIEFLENLSTENPLEIRIYFSSDKKDATLHLRLFQWQTPLPLSDILPMLENFGLRTINEQSHAITLPVKQQIWVSDFVMDYPDTNFEIAPVEKLFYEAFTKVYFGINDNDGFNKSVLAASLSWREVMMLRTYAKYLVQVGFRFPQAYMEKAFYINAPIIKDLVALFDALHNPSMAITSKDKADEIEQALLLKLDQVTSLDEDRILRRILDLIKATMRTNYYQLAADGNNHPYLAIKLNSRVIPELPLPMPFYEVFVYSPRFEAIHLRNTKVARGGIRWSDRPGDFRTEILGLMKAQVVKNAVIVPSGAKGGFVLKTVPKDAPREILQQEVLFCYRSFMQALLEITDNIVANEIIPPKNVVCHDEPDPYLVVAADKGTASFSDLANSISAEYNFWLADAFASGGSAGYDHKKMGITARGAWESVKRLFRELEINMSRQKFTVVGIGDMSGDVFGNGMMYSQNIRLIAAFDHRNIFIDPNPDAKISYAERVRLFNLPMSSWEDYDPKLLSEGGGIFKRSLKSIKLTPQVKQALQIESDSLPPSELIKAVLKAPVDLLFNGGVGTYVKSSQESNMDVGDRTNDYCRINGNELRCKVVGEGGNLGFTQLGRIEFALNGGLINTDFIDNSAGVDCSDHEVNLKILLDKEIRQGRMTLPERNKLMASLTQELTELLLRDNYNQALILSFSNFAAKNSIGLHTDYLKELEIQGQVNRCVEYLPNDKELVERKTSNNGLTRPELAVLLAYTKIYIKQEILKSNLTENPCLMRIADTALPASIRKTYQEAMQEHPLKRDIIATQLSNAVVNKMGMTFVYRLQMETGATVEKIIRAYTVASRIFETRELQGLIESLDFKISMADQYSMLASIRKLLNLSTRWFLQENHLQGDIEHIIEHYAVRVKTLETWIPDLMSGSTKDYLHSLSEKFIKAGLSKEMAHRIATYRAIYTSLNIIKVATAHHFDLVKTAQVYFVSGERLHLLWFRDQIANDTREGHWNTLARLTLRDQLDISQRALTTAIMKRGEQEDADVLITEWINSNQQLLIRWDKLLNMLHSTNMVEYTMIFIAIKELLALIQAS